jgi:hypothetical protein
MIILHKEKPLFKTKHKYYNIQWDFRPIKYCKLYASFYLNVGLDDNGFKFNLYFFNFISVNINWTRKESHAGITFSICSFLGQFINQIYDNRHWNDDQNRWMTEDDYKPQVKKKIPKKKK